nr:hypothetical protein [Tanacetum cinerariifolium]
MFDEYFKPLSVVSIKKFSITLPPPDTVEAYSSTFIDPDAPSPTVATACYSQNRYLIRPRYNKTPYELLKDRKPELKYLYVFGALCYPTSNFKDLGKLQPKVDNGIFIGSGLVQNQSALTSIKPPTKNDWDLLFQSMFDEYFKPPSVVYIKISVPTLPLPDTAGASSSTSNDQDAPSLDADVPSQQELDILFGPLYDGFFNAGSNPSMNIQSTSTPSTHTNVHAEENNNDQAEEGEHLQDVEFTNPSCAPAQEEDETSSRNVGNSNVPTFNQPHVSEYRWTKDHPLEEVRGNPSRPNIKEAMADSAWIEAMQEELHQFDRLQEEVYVAQLEGFVDPDHPEKDSSFELTAFLDVDHAGCIDTRKSTSRGIQFLALSEDRFKYLVRRICMRCLDPAELEVLEKESA